MYNIVLRVELFWEWLEYIMYYESDILGRCFGKLYIGYVEAVELATFRFRKGGSQIV